MQAGPDRDWLSIFGWACYLACSWTWCIGMFLPVLLVRDYGVWGFVVFAAPNVLGAAAMGWVLARPGAGEALAARHRGACLAFSGVTVLFHLAFLGWMVTRMFPDATAPPSRINWLLYAALPVGIAISLPALRSRPSLIPSAVVWMLSVGAIVALAIGQSLVYPDPAAIEPGLWPDERARSLLWLAPVVAFGFALCPYLDLTFHRALRLSRPSPREAFTLGFVVFFTPMILFTLIYAGWFVQYRHRMFTSVAVIAIITHIMLQAAFTTTIHANEWRLAAAPRPRVRMASVVAVLGAAAAGLSAAPFVYAGLDLGEIVYRCFMAFYGLVFPAYAWLLMIPTRDGHSGPDGPNGRRKTLIWAAAVGVAAPMYWMGFVERQEFWLAPGLAAVLLARLLLPRRRLSLTPAAAP